MKNSTSKVVSGGINLHVPASHSPSKLKTYGFAIAIIVGIGGVAVGAAGLAGFFHVGALSNMAQIDAIIMASVGGGLGIILLITGVDGTVKNRHSTTRQSGSTKRAEIIRSIDTQDGSVYGPDAWKIWDVLVLDVVPPAPQVDLSSKDKVLLYIPQRIRVSGKEQDLTLKALKEIIGGPFIHFNESVENQFGDNAATAGWVLIDRAVIPESRRENYETQKLMVEKRGYSIPSVLEAVVLNLMVFSFTGERLYGREPWIYTRCTEKLIGQHPVIVGGFGSDGLYVHYDNCVIFGNDDFGVACALRKF